VAEGINDLTSPKLGIVLITHYQRLLNYIKPQFVHILYQGRIIQSGGADLALRLEEQGYDPVIAEYGAKYGPALAAAGEKA
jgi:Fe-S cluster assembly ATP-binding protein